MLVCGIFNAVSAALSCDRFTLRHSIGRNMLARTPRHIVAGAVALCTRAVVSAGPACWLPTCSPFSAPAMAASTATASGGETVVISGTSTAKDIRSELKVRVDTLKEATGKVRFACCVRNLSLAHHASPVLLHCGTVLPTHCIAGAWPSCCAGWRAP